MTVGGQFVAVILMLVGIGLFGTLAATLTSALTTGRKKEVTNERLEALHERMDGLEQRLDGAACDLVGGDGRSVIRVKTMQER